jgi:hypothetical protein
LLLVFMWISQYAGVESTWVGTQKSEMPSELCGGASQPTTHPGRGASPLMLTWLAGDLLDLMPLLHSAFMICTTLWNQ